MGSARALTPRPRLRLGVNVLEIGILLPNNKRQHRTLHTQKDVLPYAVRVLGRVFVCFVFEFWVLGFGFWVLGFGFRVLGFGFRVLGFGFWVLGFGFGV